MILKCKMCGGDLNIENGAVICECEFCGTMQTIPALDNEKKGNLFNRANRLRRASEFDKAAAVYESIVAEFPEEAEAYWGLCLCAYGIEYVDDPASGKKMPTCHRTRQGSIMRYENFSLACEYADAVAKKLYREEAKEIDRIQQAILEIVAGEAPYDVFICYKETGADGSRTEDSVLAQDMYDALTEKGLKVFFARITLEDKLGQQYEPYIYAALHSARVMLAVGTSFEHYDAVWVKNEWSRFIGMMKEDRKKMLIPCFKGIDAYDIPEEFQGLQAQDMGKLGWLQDLTRGVMKLCGKDQPLPAVSQPVSLSGQPADPLIRRAMIALEDGDFRKADELCEQALNLEPENARAYLCKLMAELQVRRPEQLAKQNKHFDNRNNYKKILRFGDDALKAQVQGYHQAIIDRQENERKEGILQSAMQLLNRAQSYQAFLGIREQVQQKLASVAGLEAVKEIERAFLEKGQALQEAQYQLAREKMARMDWEGARAAFLILKGYRDSREMAERCREAALSAAYENARVLMNLQKYEAAEAAFAKLEDYQDSRNMAARCRDEAKKQLAAQQKAEEEERQRQLAEEKKRAAAAARKKWILAIAVLAVAAAAAFFFVSSRATATKENYERAEALLAEGKEMEALALYQKAGNYQESMARQRSILSSLAVKLDAGDKHTLGLQTNGNMKTAGSNDSGQCYVSMRYSGNLVAVAAGGYHTVGLKADGTVVAEGDNDYGQCNTRAWKDIKAISAGAFHTVGLKADGTAIAVGEKSGGYFSKGQSNVASWRNLAAIVAGGYHTVGLKTDGTVVAVGDNEEGQCNVGAWRGIVAVAAGSAHTVGLKADGTVVAVGRNSVKQCNVSGWRDIVAIECGDYYTLGLKADGTVVAVGANADGQCKVSGWRDIVAVSGGNSHTVGLKADGTVVAVGSNMDFKCNVDEWDLIK
ncbi:MAG: TIR domain-containing protein [Clostridia bacterium]|nr:TIR domain-containing protein [Clostridia bacterium]